MWGPGSGTWGLGKGGQSHLEPGHCLDQVPPNPPNQVPLNPPEDPKNPPEDPKALLNPPEALLDLGDDMVSHIVATFLLTINKS